MKYYYRYTEPVLLNDNNKTLKYHDKYDNELLHVRVQLELWLEIPCCRFTPIYVYTDNKLKHIQEIATRILNDKMKNNLNPIK